MKSANPPRNSALAYLKPKKKKRIRKMPPPEPQPLEIPKRGRVIKKSDRDDWAPVKLDNETIDIVALNIAKESTWKARKEHLTILVKNCVNFEQLAKIIHRFPSFEERVQAMRMLKNSVHDSEHAFYLFSQGFALAHERRMASEIFQISLLE